MKAEFTFYGVAYEVSGWLWADDGANNSIIVSRLDGKSIPGTEMRPGMVQIGLPWRLERRAEAALRAAREAA